MTTLRSSHRPSRFPRLLTLALAAALATPVVPVFAAETSTLTKPANKKFQVTYRHPGNREIEIVQKQYSEAEERRRAGLVSYQELSVLQANLERMLRDQPHLLTIHSEGGTLRELMAVLAEGPPTSLTLINAGDPADLDIPIPTFDLRNATWTTLIEVISNFVATRGLLLKIAGADYPNPDCANSVTCIMRRATAPDGRQAGEPAFEAFQLADYIGGGQAIDTITQAIQAGCELLPRFAPDSLKIKYHAETKLLLIAGPAPAVQVAKQIIGALPKRKI